LLFSSGCTSSTTPTFQKEDIVDAVRDICKKEHNLDVKARLAGSTLWVFLPVEDILTQAEKPEKMIERFTVAENKEEVSGGVIKVDYSIQNVVPEVEKSQQVVYNKDVLEKVNNVLQVLMRVVLSMERLKRGEPKFFYMATGDIKNGLLMQEIFYILDIKKVTYGFISREEYQHRLVQDMQFIPELIGDKEGLSVEYRDITMEEFITAQIRGRIQIKFQRPEAQKDADIDKEILKIVAYVLKTYDYKDFSIVELNNLLSGKKTLLNRAAILTKTSEQKY